MITHHEFGATKWIDVVDVTDEELELLDAATREAERHLAAMAADLDCLNAKLDAAYSRISSVRAQNPVAGDKTGE